MNPSVLVGIPQTIKKQKRLKDTDASFYLVTDCFYVFSNFSWQLICLSLVNQMSINLHDVPELMTFSS